MLQSLQIRNYVLIDSLDVEFPEGLVIISGQTGAGKSILLGALSLLLGAKADASVIGPNADNCVVEAVFRVPESDADISTLLEDGGIECENGELIVRRVVNRSGRSRSFVNDSPVPVQTLQGISSRLIDIHSQHQTLLLTDHAFQLSMLDHYAGNVPLVAECGESFRSLRSLEKELSGLNAEIARLAEEEEYLRSRCARLEEAHLKEGELEELEAEQKRLANAEEIKENLCGVENLFAPSDPDSDVMSISTALKEAQRKLEKVKAFIPEAASLSERIESSRTELDDILEEVVSANSRIELSQERLESVEDRLGLLYGLLKSFSASSVAELIAKRDGLSASLADSASMEERRSELESRIEAERKRYEGICLRLHDARTASAVPFAAAIQESVRSLEMEYSVFEVEVAQASASASGTDSVRFLFSASGTASTDVAKCASGGEMSRLMLCLKAMMARFVNMPTLIFDEIDSGVSGSVADKMGRMICRMGKDMQVFAITHLPQVAAKGNAHYLVEKEYDVLGKATTSIRPVSGQDRLQEIARMLSGSRITPAAMENARSLLGSGQGD